MPQTLLVRDAARAPDLPGAAVVVADFSDGASVRAALRPGDRVFMVSVHEDVATRIAAHQSFVDAAAEVGVGLLAYLSIVNPSPTAAFHHGRSHEATERMIRASGVPFAFLRMNLFLDDLPLWFDPDGVCRGPGGDGRVALISRDDTAAVSAAVVKGPGYEAQALDVTGEQSHSLGSSRRSAPSSSAVPSATSRARASRGSRAASPRASSPGTRTSASAPTTRSPAASSPSPRRSCAA